MSTIEIAELRSFIGHLACDNPGYVALQHVMKYLDTVEARVEQDCLDWEVRCRFADDVGSWEELPIQPIERKTFHEAHRYAELLLTVAGVEKVRFNRVGSLQGHYVSKVGW